MLSEPALYALAEPARIAHVERLEQRARAQLATDAEPVLVLAAGRAAIAVVRLGGPSRHLRSARELLAEGALRKGVAACECGFELARLLATLGHDLSAARAAALSTVERHGAAHGAHACVRDARRMVELLPAAIESATPVAAAEGVADHVAHAWASEQVQAARVTLREIAVYGRADAGQAPHAEARVVLTFDGVAVYRRGELAPQDGAPRRLFLDLDEVALAPTIEKLTEVGSAGLARVRVMSLPDGQSRVAFDVQPTTAYRLFFLSDPYRVVMDFRDDAGRAQAPAGAYTIVIDPGHGGDASGAKGPNGVREADVALSLALRARKLLSRALPFARVVLTRDRDVDLSLEGRSALANALDADLFVSIHLNASSSPDDKGGVSTYVLDSTDDAAALRLAAQENDTDESGVSALQLVLASLYRKDQVDRSLELAADVQRATLIGGRRVLPTLNDRGVKKALFYVLVGARMPAILVEASFITRPEEAELLATDGYRQALAEGIADGIARYVQRVKHVASAPEPR